MASLLILLPHSEYRSTPRSVVVECLAIGGFWREFAVAVMGKGRRAQREPVRQESHEAILGREPYERPEPAAFD